MRPASYRPNGNRVSTEHQLQTSTAVFTLGNGSPFRTLRSSASDDGLVFVGSTPNRRYIPRTEATVWA